MKMKITKAISNYSKTKLCFYTMVLFFSISVINLYLIFNTPRKWELINYYSFTYSLALFEISLLFFAVKTASFASKQFKGYVTKIVSEELKKK